MEIQEMMSAEEFREWKGHPTTVKLYRFLESLREHYQNQLLRGQTLNLASAEQTAMQTISVWGLISGLNLMLEIKCDPKEEG